MKQIVVILLSLAVAGEALAADRQRIAVLNVTLQPIATLAGAALQGKLRGRDDVLRCLRVGAVSGFAFYQSKRLAGSGDTVPAVAIANVASSMTRNAVAGRHALSRIGVTVGPTWTEVSTPFETEPHSPVHFEVSVAETIAGAVMWHRSNKPRWRDGLLSFGKHGTYDYDDRHFRGYTIGVFPGTTFRTSEITWHHETVHVIQAMEGDAIEPPACTWVRWLWPSCKDSNSWFTLRGGVILGGVGALTDLSEYPNRWTEIEATRLAENQKPR